MRGCITSSSSLLIVHVTPQRATFNTLFAVLCHLQLLGCLGGTFVDFMRALNGLHLHISLGLPGFLAPEFLVEDVSAWRLGSTSASACTALHAGALGGCKHHITATAFALQVTSTSLTLHYFSLRPGLHVWVEGMVEELAKVIFELEIDMQLLRGRQLGNCDHEVRLAGRLCVRRRQAFRGKVDGRCTCPARCWFNGQGRRKRTRRGLRLV